MKRSKMAVVLSAVLVLLLVLSAVPTQAANRTAYVSNVQITTDPRWDRSPSVFRANDDTYWLFFARGRDTTAIRGLDGYGPDLDNYDVYYKTAWSIPGLRKAKETKIPLDAPDNSQLNVSALQAADGTIWVFVATGTGESTLRPSFYYTYDGTWHAPLAVPGTYTADHTFMSAVENGGKIWVFLDMSYGVYVTSCDEVTRSWSAPVLVADRAAIPRAIVDDGEFYVVWTSPLEGIYLATSADGTVWSSTEQPIAAWPGATDWDPVLMQTTVKGKDVFQLFWSPDAWPAESQFIATSTSVNPTDVGSWSPPVRVTASSTSGANSWWTFWPQPYAEGKGVQYLFYTSERNTANTDRIDGNIWMIQLK